MTTSNSGALLALARKSSNQEIPRHSAQTKKKKQKLILQILLDKIIEA